MDASTGADCTGTSVGEGLKPPLPALCHNAEDMADIGLNVESTTGLDAFNVLQKIR